MPDLLLESLNNPCSAAALKTMNLLSYIHFPLYYQRIMTPILKLLKVILTFRKNTESPPESSLLVIIWPLYLYILDSNSKFLGLPRQPSAQWWGFHAPLQEASEFGSPDLGNLDPTGSMSKEKQKWKPETLLLHVSIFTHTVCALVCSQTDLHFHPSPCHGLAKSEYMTWLWPMRSESKPVESFLEDTERDMPTLFTSCLLLGQNMIPEIVLVTMLLKNDAITLENNQVKQIWEPHTRPTLPRTCPTAGLLTIWDHVFFVVKANLRWDFLLFATKCFLR